MALVDIALTYQQVLGKEHVSELYCCWVQLPITNEKDYSS